MEIVSQSEGEALKAFAEVQEGFSPLVLLRLDITRYENEPDRLMVCSDFLERCNTRELVAVALEALPLLMADIVAQLHQKWTALGSDN